VVFFDTLIIVLGTFELSVKFFINPGVLAAIGVMRVFRLLRLLRIIRVLLVCKELKLLAVGMFSSLSAVFWAFVLLSVLMYLGSLVCVILLGMHESLQEYFGSVPMAFYTHFVVVTLEAWPDISDAVMEADSPLWAVYFMIFIMMSGLAIMNLVTGVVCDKLMGSDTASEDAMETKQCALAAYEEDLETQLKQVEHSAKAAGMATAKAVVGEASPASAGNRDIEENLRGFQNLQRVSRKSSSARSSRRSEQRYSVVSFTSSTSAASAYEAGSDTALPAILAAAAEGSAKLSEKSAGGASKDGDDLVEATVVSRRIEIAEAAAEERGAFNEGEPASPTTDGDPDDPAKGPKVQPARSNDEALKRMSAASSRMSVAESSRRSSQQSRQSGSSAGGSASKSPVSSGHLVQHSSKRSLNSKKSSGSSSAEGTEYEYYYEEEEEEERGEEEEEEVVTASEHESGAHDVDSSNARRSPRRKLQQEAKHMATPALDVEQSVDSLMDHEGVPDDSVFSNHGPPASASNSVHVNSSPTAAKSLRDVSAAGAASRLEHILLELDELHTEALQVLEDHHGDPLPTHKDEALVGGIMSRETQTEPPEALTVGGHLYEEFASPKKS